MADATYSIRLSNEVKTEFDGLLEAVKEQRGLDNKAEALAALMPALQRESAGEVPPALTSHVASIEQSLASVQANMRAIIAVYGEVSSKEEMKAQEKMDALAASLAELRQKNADQAKQIEDQQQQLVEAAATDQASSQALLERDERIAALEAELADEKQQQTALGGILTAIQDLSIKVKA